MFHSFALQAASQTFLQHICASAALKQKLLTEAAAAVLQVYHQIITQAQALQTERYKLCVLDNNDYFAMCLWPCIPFKSQQILNYFMTVIAAFSHLYILDKGISFLLAISFTELSSDAWSGDFWWLQPIHQDKNSLDAVLRSSCSAVIINTAKISF